MRMRRATPERVEKVIIGRDWEGYYYYDYDIGVSYGW